MSVTGFFHAGVTVSDMERSLRFYRDLLGFVTRSHQMGVFLTYINNSRYDPATGAMPDENYARELMQLFSIGLVRLNRDGTPLLDGAGREIVVRFDVVSRVPRPPSRRIGPQYRRHDVPHRRQREQGADDQLPDVHAENSSSSRCRRTSSSGEASGAPPRAVSGRATSAARVQRRRTTNSTADAITIAVPGTK